MCVRVVGAGDVSIWDFSGLESYYVTYDRFLGDPNAIYMVVVSCEDSETARRRQIDFWLTFIATRMIPVEPIGKSPCPAVLSSCLLTATYIRFTALCPGLPG